MTQYKFSTDTTGLHFAHVSSIPTQEAREKRRKVLAAVRQRRRETYQRYYAKLQTNEAIRTSHHD